MFFLHDGRTADLMQAIETHMSGTGDCEGGDRREHSADCYGPSEANTGIQKFNMLPPGDKQVILDFLRLL